MTVFDIPSSLTQREKYFRRGVRKVLSKALSESAYLRLYQTFLRWRANGGSKP